MSIHAHARLAERGTHGSEAPVSAHDAVLTLSEDGIILEASPASEALFGYRIAEEILGRHISFLLPELARVPLLRGGAINPRLAFLCHCGKRFTAARREGWAFFAELFVNKVEGPAHGPLLLMVRPAGAARHGQEPMHGECREADAASLADI